MTGNGLIEAVNGVVVVAANGTLQFSVADGASQNNGQPDPTGGASCLSFEDTDYSMTPTNAQFEFAGGTGPEITVEISPPATREGSILIREQTSNTLLFTISVVQTGPTCGWYLKASPNDGGWILVDSSGVTTFGDGTGSFSVTAGDLPVGNPAPRNGYIGLYAEIDDEKVGEVLIDQLGRS